MATPVLRTEIPFTTARLKSLVKVFGTYGGYQVDPSGAGSLPNLSALDLIGAITQLTVDVKRGAQERRELNFDTAGKILEMVPGLVDFEVSLNYVYLYRASFMEACGFAGHTLEFQTRPMLFSLLLPSPNPATVPPKSLLLVDCWLKSNPIMFDVEGKDDLRIIQKVDIACGGIVEVPGN
jgi:hypothetical protein